MSNNTYDRLDSNGLLYVFQRLKTIFTGLFVSKETGKGLSTNDYTTAEKQKLAGLPASAKPVQEAVSDPAADGTGVTFIDTLSQDTAGVITPHKRTVRTFTKATSSAAGTTGLVPAPAKGYQGRFLRGDATWATAVTDVSDKAPLASPAFTGTPTAPTAAAGTNTTQIASTAFVKTAIENALSGKIDLQFSFLQQLPATGVVGTFYFIPAAHTETGVDEWEEYVWDATNSRFERIGAAKLDLTDYFNTTNLPAITNAQIDAILAS